MPTPHNRQKNKSARKIKIKSPLNLGHKISFKEPSQEKLISKKAREAPPIATITTEKPFLSIC